MKASEREKDKEKEAVTEVLQKHKMSINIPTNTLATRDLQQT